jgi:hypothetical protein
LVSWNFLRGNIQLTILSVREFFVWVESSKNLFWHGIGMVGKFVVLYCEWDGKVIHIWFIFIGFLWVINFCGSKKFWVWFSFFKVFISWMILWSNYLGFCVLLKLRNKCWKLQIFVVKFFSLDVIFNANMVYSWVCSIFI